MPDKIYFTIILKLYPQREPDRVYRFGSLMSYVFLNFLAPYGNKLFQGKRRIGRTGGGQFDSLSTKGGVTIFHVKQVGGRTVAENGLDVCGIQDKGDVGGHNVFDTAVGGADDVAAVDSVP